MPFTNTPEYKSRSLLVTVVAGAISSVAFGISIFAIGIIWLIPSVKPVVPSEAHIQTKHKDKARRRSAPPVLQGRGATPAPLSPVLIVNSNVASDSLRSSPTRHVYFLDSPTQPDPGERRYSVPPDTPSPASDNTPSPMPVPTSSASPDASPRSSSSTLVCAQSPPRNPASRLPDPWDETINSSPPSSVSSRPSLYVSTRLPNRIKERWNKKSTASASLCEPSGDSSQSDDTSSQASSTKSARRSSLGFNSSWLTSRTRTVSDSSSVTANPSTPRPSPGSMTPANDNSFSSCLSNLPRTTKSQRRSSAPVRATVPRTQPYAYPYFAAPPIPGYQEFPRASSNENCPNSKDEALLIPVKQTPLDRSPDDERKQQIAKTQTSLGLSITPLPRRSLTEDTSHSQI